MRIVAGSARGRRLMAPPGRDTRPTSDRVRESVFNVLMSMGGIEGLAVADLFAGTGALGIEALSRGAASAVLVDRDPRAVSLIRANLAATGVEGGQVVRADVLRWVETAPHFDVVFADPPYAFDRWTELLGRLRADLVALESDHEIDPGPDWEVLRVKRYGTTVVTLAQPERATERKGAT